LPIEMLCTPPIKVNRPDSYMKSERFSVGISGAPTVEPSKLVPLFQISELFAGTRTGVDSSSGWFLILSENR
jgi:hypothetical protein